MINNNAHLDQNEVVQDALQANDFGAVLKKAREAAGLSIDEVAQKLIVSADIIKAIDNSQAAALPALTFTQGYIRAYARMFDLSADEIIEAYNSVVPETKKVTTPQSVLLVHKTGSDAIIKFISFGFIVLAIIALFAWLYQADFRMKLTEQSVEASNPSTIEPASELDSEQQKQTIQAPRPQLEYRSEQQEEQAVIENALDIEIAQADSSVQLESAALNSEADSEVAGISTENKVQESAQVTQQTSTTQVNDVIATDHIMLIASDDSWCEIHDANGQRLYYRLLSQGEKISVQGAAPFRVFLGNASEVRVEVNQHEVSFDHLINRNSKVANLNIESDAKVARFYNR